MTDIDQSDDSTTEADRRSMTFEQCRRIAAARDTSMDYLAGLTDGPKPYSRKK